MHQLLCAEYRHLLPGAALLCAAGFIFVKCFAAEVKKCYSMYISMFHRFGRSNILRSYKGELMPASTILLIASLGAILIILALHVNIFVFERRAYLVMWFIGWAVIGVNYALDAFFPFILRENPWVIAISSASYVFAKWKGSPA